MIGPTVGIFKVQIAVPGDASWCTRQTEQFDAYIAERSRDELHAMPATTARVDAERRGSTLRLSFIEVPGVSAWAAAAEAERFVREALPEVHEKASELTIAVTVQDPDPERRRPVGR